MSQGASRFGGSSFAVGSSHSLTQCRTGWFRSVFISTQPTRGSQIPIPLKVKGGKPETRNGPEEGSPCLTRFMDRGYKEWVSETKAEHKFRKEDHVQNRASNSLTFASLSFCKMKCLMRKSDGTPGEFSLGPRYALLRRVRCRLSCLVRLPDDRLRGLQSLADAQKKKSKNIKTTRQLPAMVGCTRPLLRNISHVSVKQQNGAAFSSSTLHVLGSGRSSATWRRARMLVPASALRRWRFLGLTIFGGGFPAWCGLKGKPKGKPFSLGCRNTPKRTCTILAYLSGKIVRNLGL